jgi:hypothetical protein
MRDADAGVVGLFDEEIVASRARRQDLANPIRLRDGSARSQATPLDVRGASPPDPAKSPPSIRWVGLLSAPSLGAHELARARLALSRETASDENSHLVYGIRRGGDSDAGEIAELFLGDPRECAGFREVTVWLALNRFC